MMFLVATILEEMPEEDAYKTEFYEIMNHNRVHEGNWGAWLGGHNKLKSFTWIGNKNSGNKRRNRFNAEVVPNYVNIEKEDYKFDNYNFDHIFVCMSPQYIPQITGITLPCSSAHLRNFVERVL